jgi:molybdopterin-binding protein
LKIIGALDYPTKGKVLFDGVELDRDTASDVRKRTTMVFQKTVMLKGTVKDNLVVGLKLRGLSKNEIEKKAHETLNLVALKSKEKRNARDLSGGEKQRLSLARALILGCEYLILDEPSANLDPESLEIVNEVLTKMRDDEITIILATHNLQHASEVSDRIILMDRGEILESVKPEKLYIDQSLRMARFTRSGNIFTGESDLINEISKIDVGNGVEISAAFSKKGKVTIFVRPEDIIISTHKIKSSARNSLQGRIVSIENYNNVIRMKVDVGIIFIVQITRKSLGEMSLKLGDEVFLTFKASSVHLI